MSKKRGMLVAAFGLVTLFGASSCSNKQDLKHIGILLDNPIPVSNIYVNPRIVEKGDTTNVYFGNPSATDLSLNYVKGDTVRWREQYLAGNLKINVLEK